MLDSSIDLGINTHGSQAVQFKKTVNCSVLALTNRTGNSSGLDVQGNTTYSTYLFGSVSNGLAPNVTTYLDVAASQTNNLPFSVTAFYADAGVSTQLWTPSPPFARPDGDVSLFFLISNDIVYADKVFDPWFWATDPATIPIGLSTASKYFEPVNPVSAMGCVDQYTICNRRRKRCTNPGGIYSLPSEVQRLDLNAHQKVTTERLLQMLKNTDTYSSVYGAGSAALKASDTVLGILSSGLPPNQWQIEAEGWFQISLAKMQAYAVEFASNSQQLSPYSILHFPDADSLTRPIWHAQCFSQRVANPGQYQVFSMLGLMLLLVLGLFFLIAAKIIARFVATGNHHEYAADDKFELQRMALNSEMLNTATSFPVYKPTSGPLPTARLDVGGAVTYDASPAVAALGPSPASSPPPVPAQPQATIIPNASMIPQSPNSTALGSVPTAAAPAPNVAQQHRACASPGPSTNSQSSATPAQPLPTVVTPSPSGTAQAATSAP